MQKMEGSGEQAICQSEDSWVECEDEEVEYWYRMKRVDLREYF